MYILKITGLIPEQKHLEFEQSLSEIHEQIKDDCTEFAISRDLNEKDLYYLHIYWNTKETYQSFLDSQDYHVLCGSFQVLGIIREITSGKLSDISS